MNITELQLELEYEGAKALFGALIDSIEQEYDLPTFSMYAIGSRETNLNPFFVSNPGDEGHGHGLWQVDDRSHPIPDDWATDLDWQCRTAADIFNDCLGMAEDDFIAACNYYNSGQPQTQYTTGGDYGPDVTERREYLFNKYGQQGEFVAGQSLVNLKSGLAIDVSGASTDTGAGIVQYVVTGKKNQSVVLEDVGHGLSRIRFEHSDKYLDYDPNRLEAVQYDKADVPGQEFHVGREPNGAYTIETFDGKVLDIEAESNDPDARAIFWPKKGSDAGTVANQQFVIVRFR